MGRQSGEIHPQAMRVLWFSNTPSWYYDGSSAGYNGGGWISSLETLVRDKVDLGIAFLTNCPDDMPRCIEGVRYYPVYDPTDNRTSRVQKLIFGYEHSDKYLVSRYLDIIHSFSPDVIQVFGSEHSFGLVSERTDIPVILHVQGILRPYYEAFLPWDTTWLRYVLSAGGGPAGIVHRLYTRSRWRYGVRREKRILSSVRNYFCRTEWDKSEMLRANSSAKIFWGGEVLRQDFYDAEPWSADAALGGGSEKVFVTTISEPPYKGMDVVLRTGSRLRERGVKFEWRVFGNVAPAFFEKLTGITCSEAGVILRGVADANALARELRGCSAYVHPSYIDNSPNSVCEAQMLGAPVFAAAVGGVPSLIEHGRTGWLFPAGDHVALSDMLAGYPERSMDALQLGYEQLKCVSDASRAAALCRHDKDRIVATLLQAYGTLMDDK